MKLNKICSFLNKKYISVEIVESLSHFKKKIEFENTYPMLPYGKKSVFCYTFFSPICMAFCINERTAGFNVTQ